MIVIHTVDINSNDIFANEVVHPKRNIKFANIGSTQIRVPSEAAESNQAILG